MAKEKDDADHGLTPREWLDSDPVPLTPDIDFNDPEQRSAWMRANNEENEARRLELQARRVGGTRAPPGPDDADGRPRPRLSSTTVVPVRFLNAEQRALVRLARRRGVAVSDLVRRWVRDGLDEANGTALAEADLVEADLEAIEADDRARRLALADAADAAVQRITDEVRRLRDIVVAGG